MSTRRILVSSSNAQLLEAALGEWRAGGASERLIVAATRGAADDFARQFAMSHGGLFGVHRATLAQLAALLAVEPSARLGLAAAGRLALEALAARSVAECRVGGRALDYFDPVCDTPGFARALASTLLELRLESVDGGRLASTGPPGRDLARLLDAYEQQLSERKLADAATTYRLAAETAARSAHRLVGLPLLLLDCPLVSTSQQDLAAALAARSPDVLAICPDSPEGQIRAWERILGEQARRLDHGPPPDALGRLRGHLFSTQAPAPAAFDSSLELFSAPGEALECVEIARRIRLLAGQGAGFDGIAVLLRNPEIYQPLLEDGLRRAGIPGWFSRGVARPDPAGRAFLALLACAAEGLSASRFAEYLSLGQVPASGGPPPDWVPTEDELAPVKTAAPEPADTAPNRPEEDDESSVIDGTLRAPFQWEKLLVDAAVIGGRDRWARRLRGWDRELRLQISALDDPAGPQHQHLERQVERLGHLQRFAMPLIEFLDSLPARAPWGEWLERLTQLAGMALGNPRSVLALLAELAPMDAVGPVELDEVRGVFAERLRFLRQGHDHPRFGQVFIGAIAEARGRAFDVVFLPGLGEGIFPRKALEDPLLLDRYRAPLAAGLARQDDRVARERLLLQSAAAAARSKLVVSYPRVDVMQGRPRVPSFYALEVFRAAAGRLPELREFSRAAAQASPAQLGWPAPRDPAQAIDDAEYDLAFLGRFLTAAHQPEKGRARYVLQVNDHLARSLRARWSRWRKSWTADDGLVVKPGGAALDVLRGERLAARAYSPTTLERFAACPYRFLLHGIHRLRPREEKAAIEQLDPLTRGGIFHRVQFRLLGELRDAGLLPVHSDNLAQAFDLADRVLTAVAAEQQEELAPAIPRVWAGEIENLRTDLRGWVVELAQELAWQPLYFELAFGLPASPERDPRSRPDEAVILDGVRLRGSMDLVERHLGRGSLRVTDHKTGRATRETAPMVGGGEVLQPVLYGLAAENMLGEPVVSSRLFYCTQRGRYQRLDVALNDDARAGARQVLETIDQSIAQGFLPAAPSAGACTNCDYRPVCGPYEELRVAVKQRDRLAALDRLRRLP